MLIKFTDFYSFHEQLSVNYSTRMDFMGENHYIRYRTRMPHYLTRKCGAGLLICIRGSGKTRKQINENSTPHLYRMSFAYGYMCQVLLPSPASILKFTRFLIQGVSETHQLYMPVVCTGFTKIACFSIKQQSGYCYFFKVRVFFI